MYPQTQSPCMHLTGAIESLCKERDGEQAVKNDGYTNLTAESWQSPKKKVGQVPAMPKIDAPIIHNHCLSSDPASPLLHLSAMTPI